MKFFIIDDDSDIIDFMATLLEAEGHSVSSEIAGATAISRIVKQSPDCVLTDLMMADMDGLDLCRELRNKQNLQGLKIVFVSARTSEYWQKRARESGANGYITKPLNAGTFVSQVERIIGETDPSEGP